MSSDTILHDSGASLDNFFEGTEKTLEIWFSFAYDEKNDLRLIPREALDEILTHVRAKILSKISTDSIDAYVLSESSLFVSKNKVLLKTCGTTTLLLGLQSLFDAVFKYTSAIRVEGFHYKRKCMLQPGMQEYPHNDFDTETNYLRQTFPDGVAYTFGQGIDAWVVYAYKNNEHLRKTHSCVEFNISKFEKELGNLSMFESPIDKYNCEILMTELNETNMLNFYQDDQKEYIYDESSYPLEENVKIAKHNTSDYSEPSLTISTELRTSCGSKTMFEKSGLNKCFDENTQPDCFDFEPYGFSMNALNDDIYHTIHVTPQPECSYASYQTNLSIKKGVDVCHDVLGVFDPKKFVFNVLSTEEIDNFREILEIKFSNYVVTETSFSSTNEFNIHYASLVKR